MKILKAVFQWLVVLLMAALFIRGMMFIFIPPGSALVLNEDSIIVLDFTGMIIEADTLIDTFKTLEKESKAVGYVLRVNSGGGLVAPSQEMYEYMKTLKKPLYVAMGSSAASGGYMISLPAQKIYAMPSTVTGSIGVIMRISNVEGLYSKIGLTENIIKSGKFKDTGNPTRPMSEEDEAVLSAVVMDMYEQFVGAVSESRQMSIEDTKTLADGRIYTGHMALELGLVDALGSWEDAYRDMRDNVFEKPNMPYHRYEQTEMTALRGLISKFDGIFKSGSITRPAGFYFISDY